MSLKRISKCHANLGYPFRIEFFSVLQCKISHFIHALEKPLAFLMSYQLYRRVMLAQTLRGGG